MTQSMIAMTAANTGRRTEMSESISRALLPLAAQMACPARRQDALSPIALLAECGASRRVSAHRPGSLDAHSAGD